MNLLAFVQPDELDIEIEEFWYAYPNEIDGLPPAWAYECFDLLEVFY